jgi:hypothetical protein
VGFIVTADTCFCTHTTEGKVGVQITLLCVLYASWYCQLYSVSSGASNSQEQLS